MSRQPPEPTRRITRSLVRSAAADGENDDTETDQTIMSEDENESNNDELYTESTEDSPANQPLDDSDDITHPEQNLRASSKPRKTARSLASHVITFREMQAIYRGQHFFVEHARTAKFRHAAVGCLVKFGDSLVALVVGVESGEPYEVSGVKMEWMLRVKGPFLESRLITVADLLDDPLVEEDHTHYVEEWRTKELGSICSSLQARKERRRLDNLEKYTPSLVEEEEFLEKRARLNGVGREVLSVDLRKKKRVVEETTEMPAEDEQQQTQEQGAFVFTKEIVDGMRECARQCKEMEDRLIYHPQFEPEIARICTDFFATFDIPTAPCEFDPCPRCFIEPKDRKMEEDLHEVDLSSI